MIISKEGHTSIVAQERGTLIQFLGKLRESYPSLKEDHIILNLFSFTTLKAADLLEFLHLSNTCLLYTSPSPRDRTRSRMPSSA